MTPATSEAGRPRPGFTLVEILAVITIIGILATITVAGMNAAVSARRRARARGEIQAIVMACESYRKVYGDYPCATSGTLVTDSATFRKDLFAQLTGSKVLSVSVSGGTPTVSLITYTAAGKTRMKGFLSAGIVTSNDDVDSTKAYEFRDPWNNPYGYRYRALGTSYANWNSSDFLLVSAGARFFNTSTLAEDEYWSPTTTTNPTPMTESGVVPSTYFLDDEKGLRADNLVNWQTN